MIEDLPNKSESEFENMNTDEKIIWRSGQYDIPGGLSKEEAFKKLMKKIAEKEDFEEKPVISLKRWYYTFSAAAAVILIIIGFWFFGFNKSLDNMVAEKGQQTDFRLPDGSLVSLNADTKISFDKSKFNKKRNVQMEGEAFFNVEKGNTFTISTSLAEIKILGTSFNVFARDNQFKVSCFTGKILVTSGADSVIIVPDQTAYLENNKLVIKKEQNINSIAKWRIGEFNFENIPLNLVFNEIERQFNVTFVLPKLDDKKFSGSFSNKNLVNALDIICIPMGLDYEIGSNSKIFIKNKSD